MPKKQYGFWSYDAYPYVLGSPGTMNDDGWFRADRYGGACFRPIKVLSLAEGCAVAQRLEALAKEYEAVVGSVRRGFIGRAILAASWLPVRNQDSSNRMWDVTIRELILTKAGTRQAAPPQKA